jgi:hypothetical protein
MSSRYGFIGSRTGPSSIDAPLPFAHQWIGSTPFEKYTHAKRTGGLLDAAGFASCAGSSDSIQGSARATPVPRRKWRREGCLDSLLFIVRFPYLNL